MPDADHRSSAATIPCIAAEFTDFDQFRETVSGWEVDTWLFHAGGFSGSLFQALCPSSTWNFGHARLGPSVKQAGGTPGGLQTFALPDRADVSLYWRSQQVSGDCLLIYPPNAEHDAITPPGYGAYVISLAADLLEAEAEALQLGDWPVASRRPETVPCAPAVARALRTRMHTYEGLLRRGVHGRELETTRQAIARALVQAVLGRSDTTPPGSRALRSRVISAAEAYVHTHAWEALTVAALARATRSSVRSLQQEFREMLGVTPKAYIRSARLHGVRRMLLGLEGGCQGVTDAANAWSFWHMGQFAADYRKLFGELPSETRARGRQ